MSFKKIPLCNPSPGGGCVEHGAGCNAPGKVPLQADWAARGDEAKPEGNYGILTGPVSGILVIDVDSQESADVFESWGLPETATVQSGRQEGIGRHYYFRWPEGLVRVPNRFEGVELKGPGRQVVGPGSLHKSGNRYTIANDAGIAELPSQFVERIADEVAQREKKSSKDDATSEAWDAREALMEHLGDYDEQMDGDYVALCPAHDDHSPSLVVGVSGNKVLVHCRSGCTERAILEALELDMNALYGETVTLEDEPVAADERLTGGLGDRFSLTELLAADLPEIEWALPGVVPAGLTLFAGPPKLGKSWWVLDLAISQALGRPFMGRDVPKGDALYLALEDNPRRLKGRALKVLGGSPAPRRLDLWTRAGKLDNGLVTSLVEWIDGKDEPKLIIIDTLGRVQGASAWTDSKDGGYAAAVEALATLQDLAAARGVAVVVITHTKKGGWAKDADPLEAVLGSQGYAGTADAILVLKRDRGEEAGELFVTGREIEEEIVEAVYFDTQTCRWAVGDPEYREAEAPLSAKILDFFDEDKKNCWTLKAKDIAKKMHRSYPDVLATLKELEAAGDAVKVTKTGRGGTAELWGPKLFRDVESGSESGS